MNRRLQLSALMLAGALLAPAVGQAAVPAPAGQTRAQIQVYDRAHKDRHVWDEREAAAYRRYLAEQHRKYLAYQRLTRTRQDQYWNWRHQHPD